MKRLHRSLYQLIVDNFLISLVITSIVLRVAQLGIVKFCGSIHAFHEIRFILAAFILKSGTRCYHNLKQQPHVYLVDYACFKPNINCRAPLSSFVEHLHLKPFLDHNTVNFVTRVLEHSGIGEETYLPPVLHYIPPNCSFNDARYEGEMVIFSAIDDLLAKTCMHPNDIDILIVNCSIFSPIPSYTDMIINRYRLRSDIKCVHLSGMGCSAGLISVGLASNLLKITPHGRHALVVSTETTSNLYYKGRKREMQLTNILFRMGGAAVLLSNSRAKARFRLRHLMRRIVSTQENAYKCVFLEEDGEGNIGVNLSKCLIGIGGDALRASLTLIAPLVLPTSENLLFLLSYIRRKISHERIKLYVPNFCMAFEHFCIHAGGPAVIDAVQQNLNLSDEHVEASKMTLHRFGNTSSSSLWYELAYIEAKGRMLKRDRVLMIGFGSGYKCNIAVWECLNPTNNVEGPWTQCIHRYPIKQFPRKASK